MTRNLTRDSSIGSEVRTHTEDVCNRSRLSLFLLFYVFVRSEIKVKILLLQ